MSEELPEDARNLIQTIDAQIAAITGLPSSRSDEDHALRQYIQELTDYKQQIIADPTIASDKRPRIKEEEVEEEESARPAKRHRKTREAECNTCLDTFPMRDTARLRCCHTRYCRPCFQEWITTSIQSKVLPKCCNDYIQLSSYSRFVNQDVKQEHKALKAEFDAESKIWCSNTACGFVIKVDENSEGFLQCSKCRRKTCASCRLSVPEHKGRNKVCPAYVADEQLNDAVEQHGLKRCPGCHVPVQKTHGCLNIRCTCGVMFCYRCGMRKTREGDPCKCSDPDMEVNAIVEDPTDDGDTVQEAPVVRQIPPRRTDNQASFDRRIAAMRSVLRAVR